MLPPESATTLNISSSTTPTPSSTKCPATSLCATTTLLRAAVPEAEEGVTVPAALSGIRGATTTAGTETTAATGGGMTIAVIGATGVTGTTATPTESGGTSVADTIGDGVDTAVTRATRGTRETVIGTAVTGETGTVAAEAVRGLGVIALGQGRGRLTAAPSRRDVGDARRSERAVSCIPMTVARSSRKVSLKLWVLTDVQLRPPKKRRRRPSPPRRWTRTRLLWRP